MFYFKEQSSNKKQYLKHTNLKLYWCKNWDMISISEDYNKEEQINKFEKKRKKCQCVIFFFPTSTHHAIAKNQSDSANI